MIEYEALILGLETTILLGVQVFDIYGDSQLIINKFNGIYQCKNEILQKYKDILDLLFGPFNFQTIHNVPRSSNGFTDTMASLSSLIPWKPKESRLSIVVQHQDQPTHIHEIPRVNYVDTNPCNLWYSQISDYLSQSIIPSDLSTNSRRSFLQRDNPLLSLVTYGFDGIFLCCLKSKKSICAI